MNPRIQHLPAHWQEWTNSHPNLSKGEHTPEFNNKVFLTLEDGSTMFFNYAFLVKDEQRNEVAVFTEHCGYYWFPYSMLNDFTMLGYVKPFEKVK